MHGIAKGIEEGGDLRRNLRRDQPEVSGGDDHILGKRAVLVDANAFGMGAEMAPAGPAVAADAAGDMALSRDTVAHLVALDAGAERRDIADEFMADDERRLDRAL